MKKEGELPSLAELDRNGITDAHRIAIANCILAWASCESQLRALLTALEGRPLDKGATEYSRKSPDDCWKKIIQTLRQRNASADVLEAVQRNRQASRDFYETRKLIAHAGCPGTWSKDPDYLLFAPFEVAGEGQFLIAWVPLADIIRSTTFAVSATKMTNKIMKQMGF